MQDFAPLVLARNPRLYRRSLTFCQVSTNRTQKLLLSTCVAGVLQRLPVLGYAHSTNQPMVEWGYLRTGERCKAPSTMAGELSAVGY